MRRLIVDQARISRAEHLPGPFLVGHDRESRPTCSSRRKCFCIRIEGWSHLIFIQSASRLFISSQLQRKDFVLQNVPEPTKRLSDDDTLAVDVVERRDRSGDLPAHGCFCPDRV